MIWLEVADLVIIASRTLKLDTDRVLALLDPSAAEAALGQARSGAEDDEPATQAARLLHALVDQRPLRRGNQQVALAAMLQLLALNGWEVDPDPAEATRAVVAELAAGTLDTSGVAVWLAPRLRPLGHAVTCAKEASMRRWRPLVAMSMGMATEHLLLGLLYEGEGVAAKTLGSLGISLEAVRAQVEQIIGHGPTTPTGHIPFTPRAKKVLELSLREALQLGHHYIGTEHLLLGLLREGEGVAAQVLARLGADHARVREAVLELLTHQPERAGLLTDECEEPNAETRLVRLTLPAELVDTAEQLVQVRQQKEAAFDAGDLDHATTLRDQEKQLLADRLRLEREWTSGVDVQTVIAENQRVHRELERLRELLRQHGIEPNGGTARTA